MYRDFQVQAEAVDDHAAAERFRRLREDQRRNRDGFLAVLRDLGPAEEQMARQSRDQRP
jgi:hypothetical protein